MKIFGDDGFRDVYGQNLLSIEFLKNFFNKLNYIFKIRKIDKLLIGYDNRISSKNILKVIVEKIVFPKKIFITDIPVSTAGLQYLSKNFNCFGLMITASHFPAKYNGFKFFINGFKLNKSDEIFLEKKLILRKDFKNKKDHKIIIKKINQSKYIDYLNKNSVSKLNLKIKIDCSNGSAGFLKKKINFFNNSYLINTNQDGNKINLNCGTNNLEKNIKGKIIKNYDFLFAFDGDADRFLVAEKNYGIIETEKIALIYANYFSKKKLIDNIVATEIVNPWLVSELKKIGIKTIISKVGDRNVVEKIIKNKSSFGFETSGHFCFNHSMDGIYAAMQFLKIIKSNQSLVYKILNKPLSHSKIILAVRSKFVQEIKKFIKDKTKSIKFCLRKSIWNNYYKLYIFYEYKDFNELKILNKFLINKSIKIKIKN